MENQRQLQRRAQRWRRRLIHGLLAALSCLGCWLLRPAYAGLPNAQVPPSLAQVTLEQGQQLYQQGQLTEAITVLRQVADTSPDPAQRVVALRNLALVHQQLGQWAAAEAALAAAQAELTAISQPQQMQLQAQLLEVQGSLQLDLGQGEAAIATWGQVAAIYTQTDQPAARLQAQINQAQAMQRLGFHRRAITTLEPVVLSLNSQPPSLINAVALRTLGDSLVQVGSLSDAQTALQASQAMAQAIADPEAGSAAALSLGNLMRAQGNTDAALTYFFQAETAASPLVRVQAQLNRLAIYGETARIAEAQALWGQILAALNQLPPHQATLFARINLAQTLIALPVTPNPTPRQIADLLAVTIKQAQAMGDPRSESFATGTLGHLYEVQQQWPAATELSQKALQLAQTAAARDIVYRWQWQLGRIYKAQQQTEKAITAYSGAVDSLTALRTDLAAVNPAAQVSFQDNVEPIHRDLVALLLDPGRSSSQSDLEKARTTIESLQLAELDNFFREACLEGSAVDIDQLDQRAAVIYPVILANRLEVIVSLPDQPLRHYASPVAAADLGATIEQLQQLLVLRVGQQYLQPAQTLYNWMIRPAAADLRTSNVDTLVFVLDGELRNIPMAVLNDGEQFLLEQYNLALTPGLQLINPKPIQSQALRVLTAGLSESRQGFSALPNVVEEVEQIQSTVPADVLLNEGFTLKAFESSLTLDAAPIVHLATHGKFSSTNQDTFVLTWDNRIDITTLNNLLQTAELKQTGPIELLVLSACQTATGDKRAALGLAGMAVRSGARSTIATLWQVNDEATAMLMTALYDNLAQGQLSKAEALRQAQLVVMQEPRFRQHPFFWAPYVLVGNWL